MQIKSRQISRARTQLMGWYHGKDTRRWWLPSESMSVNVRRI